MSSSAIQGQIFNDPSKAADGSAASPSFSFANSTSTGVYRVSANTLGISTAGVQRVVVDASGNVGIGTASPATTLQVQKNLAGGTSFAAYIDNGAAGAGTNVAGIAFSNAGNPKASITAAVYGNDYLSFNVGGAGTTERMRLDASGGLRVLGGVILGVNADPAGKFYVSSSILAAGAGTNALKWNSSTGQVTYDTSSARYKDSIRDSVYGLNSVLHMRSVQFEYKDTGRSDVGLIAEELDPIIPELVGKDNEGKPDSVAYDRVVSVLVKAIQELSAKNDALEARLAALESK